MLMIVLPLQVCIAKCNSSPSLDSVLYQDLIIGEGQGVEGGDALEVAYTGWLFQNNGLGQVKGIVLCPSTCLTYGNVFKFFTGRDLCLTLKVFF